MSKVIVRRCHKEVSSPLFLSKNSEKNCLRSWIVFSSRSRNIYEKYFPFLSYLTFPLIFASLGPWVVWIHFWSSVLHSKKNTNYCFKMWCNQITFRKYKNRSFQNLKMDSENKMWFLALFDQVRFVGSVFLAIQLAVLHCVPKVWSC